MSDTVKKWHEMQEEKLASLQADEAMAKQGVGQENKNHYDLSLILNDDIAKDEWEAYYEYHKDALENCEDFEVAYGFVIWIFNRNYKKIQ